MDIYSYISWQRTWDDFALNVSAFHYPSRGGLGYMSVAGGGTGGQVIVIFNH